MSAIDSPKLDGFEQRLLDQLKHHIDANRTDPRPQRAPAAARPRRRHHLTHPLGASVAAATVAALVLLLSILPASQPTLAQAFPILTHRTRVLPLYLKRILEARGIRPNAVDVDVDHAYAFQTPTGTGYVVAERGTRWLCIVVPGFDLGSGSARCVTVIRRQLADGLRVTLTDDRHAREEIVQLLPNGATASLDTADTSARRIALHTGVLAVLVNGPARITTTIAGQDTTVAYAPGQPNR